MNYCLCIMYVVNIMNFLKVFRQNCTASYAPTLSVEVSYH